MRKKLFNFLASLVTTHPGKVILTCVFITLILIAAAGRLGMKTQFSAMMPQDIPQIKEFQEIIKAYESASSVMIAVESPKGDVAEMKRCAEALVQKLKSIKNIRPSEGLTFKQKMQVMFSDGPAPGVPYDTIELVKRIDYKIDKDFFASHGLMLQKPKDLDSFMDMFSSLKLPGLIKNINDNFEKEYIEDSENMATLDGEAQTVQGLEGVYKLIKSIGTYMQTGDSAAVLTAVSEFSSGPDYFLSPDNTLLLIMVQPTVSMDDFDDAMYLGYQVLDTMKLVGKIFPDITIGGSGWMLIQIDETEAAKKDFGMPSLIALILILILLIGSYRSWKNPFFSVFVLILAIIWTTGILALILHYLNIMSAVFGLILIGLGIDFGIHILSGYKDGRESGLSLKDAIMYMYQSVGAGVITGGLTTAAVFFTMGFSGFEALTEMGIAIGTGILVVLMAMMILLPALIVWDNKGYSVIGGLMRKLRLGIIIKIWKFKLSVIYWIFRLPPFKLIGSLLDFRFLRTSGKIMANPIVAFLFLIISAGLVYLSLQAAKTISFEYDMMELEPIGIPSVIAQDKILDKFEISPDYALMKVKNLEDCRSKIEQLKKLGNRTGIIGSVDGITEFIPTHEDQLANIPKISSFRKKVDAMQVDDNISTEDIADIQRELKRLHNNFAEIGELSVMSSGEGNKVVRKCDQIVGKSDSGSSILQLANLVATHPGRASALGKFQAATGKALKQKLSAMTDTSFVTLNTLPRTIKERYVNPLNDELLVTVFPKSSIWEETTLRKFNSMTSEISEKITGSPIIMMLFIDLMKEKGRVALIIGACTILLLLFADFFSFVFPILAAIPLAIGTIWMLGLMAFFEIKFNIQNFMALPLIIGIGIDDGVHILHRYRIEGRGSIPIVLKFTGRAVLLTTLTTIISFGSMGLATHRGTASMGQVLALGVGACFLSSVYVLPALITVFEKVFKKRPPPP